MKTRMRISPFHVSMTILKTQIEKRENSKERCSHYLTKRTVCVILCAWQILKCAEILGAKSNWKQCNRHRKCVQTLMLINEWNFGVHGSMQDEMLPWITMDNGQYYLWKLVIYCVALVVYIYFYFMYYW